MKAKHPKYVEYVVESGNYRWRGKARSTDEAINRALKNADEDLSLLTRVTSIKTGVWHYISTVAVLKRLGLFSED